MTSVIRKLLFLPLLVCFLLPAAGRSEAPKDLFARHVAQSGPRTPEEERKGFHVPPGFEVQLVAAEPNVRKPINMNFDDRGRLWVTESVEYPFPAGSEVKHRDSIRILEDTNGDGRADVATIFTDGLNIPIGVLPVTHGAVVYSIPSIYRLTDRDGDDRADQREVLYGKYGFVDTHGMTGEFTWGFDGWVYACHGYANTSEIKAADGSTIRMRSGNTYRFKADGARIEHFTHGQVNPFGLALDPLGNLYSCDCHSRPIYQLLRGAYYPSFSASHDGIGFGPEMMSHEHNSTGLAGIACYAADHFPAEYRDTIFIGNVLTNRINNDRLEWHGSTPKAIEMPDFLRSDDPWFRPVDIKLGPDGALYVADFYNRIIGHYEVPLTHPGRDRERGRIWRIVYRGTEDKANVPNPIQPRRDWAKTSVEELVADLAHPNLSVRMKAMNQLVERGGPAGVEATRKVMKPSSNRFQRMHGLWVLERRGAGAEAELAAAAEDADRGVRVHAMRVLAERATLAGAQRELAWKGLKDPDACVRRAAAESLARHPASEHLRPLLDLCARVPADDTHLLHVVRMAVREQLRPAAAWARLPLKDWSQTDARIVADVAPGVPSAASAQYLLAHLQKFTTAAADRDRFVYHVARYAPAGAEAALLHYARNVPGTSLKQQTALFKAVQQGLESRGAAPDEAVLRWAEDLTRKLLDSPEETEVLQGIEMCGKLKMDWMHRGIAVKVEDKKTSATQRIEAMKALVALEPRTSIGPLGRLLNDATEPILIRAKSAHGLAGINREESRVELLRGLNSAPEPLALAIAIGLASSDTGGKQLLEAVAAGKASPRLLQDQRVELRLARSSIPDVARRLADLTRGLPPADERLRKLLQHRQDGFPPAKADAGLGAQVFAKNCAACHQIANQGARIGPQLDGIGARGLERLLEDVLDPSRNVDQAFWTTTLQLDSGQLVSGLVLREEGEILVLADPQGKEVRVPKRAIEERSVSPLSPMPANLSEQIPEKDFYHLLAYLLEQQAPKGRR